MNILNYRNAISNNQDSSIVDLEIETDTYGWIPTTIMINDGDLTPYIVGLKQWVYDNPDLIAPYIAPTDAESLAIEYPEKIAEINAYLGSSLELIAGRYSDAERETWSIQSSEALAYHADNSALTPFIDGLINGRSITKAEMVGFVVANSSAYYALVSGAMNAVQIFRDRADAALASNSIDLLRGITIE